MARNFSSDNLNAGDVTYLDSIEFSWMCWVYLDTVSADQILWEKAFAGFDGISVFFDNVGPNANKVWEVFTRVPGSPEKRIKSATANTAVAGQWAHLGGWYQGNNASGLALFIDGLHSNGSPASTVGGGVLGNEATDLLIGMHSDSGSRRFLDGSAANLTFWAGRLNVTDFAAAAGGVPHGLIRRNDILRNFPIGLDSPDPDISGSGDTLTVTGTVISDNPPVGPELFRDPGNIITLAAVGGVTRPQGPLGHPFHGPFAGPVG